MRRNLIHRNSQMLKELLLGTPDVDAVVVAAFLARDGVENQIDQEHLGEGEEIAGAGLTKAGEGHWRCSNPSHLPSCNNSPAASIRAHQHAYYICLRRRYLVLPGLRIRKENPWH